MPTSCCNKRKWRVSSPRATATFRGGTFIVSMKKQTIHEILDLHGIVFPKKRSTLHVDDHKIGVDVACTFDILLLINLHTSHTKFWATRLDRESSHVISNCKSWRLSFQVAHLESNYEMYKTSKWRSSSFPSDHIYPPNCVNHCTQNDV